MLKHNPFENMIAHIKFTEVYDVITGSQHFANQVWGCLIDDTPCYSQPNESMKQQSPRLLYSTWTNQNDPYLIIRPKWPKIDVQVNT